MRVEGRGLILVCQLILRCRLYSLHKHISFLGHRYFRL